MKKYAVHFTVHGILTTFAEVIEADEIDRVAFRKILNERIKAADINSSVNEMFMIVEKP